MYRYIGQSNVSFEYGKVYKAKMVKDDFGDMYSILDESGEWYLYGIDFFETNFEDL